MKVIGAVMEVNSLTFLCLRFSSQPGALWRRPGKLFLISGRAVDEESKTILADEM
ncbi:MAG: hypothetical protein ABI718_01945 [Acidobacteriota bacterium]